MNYLALFRAEAFRDKYEPRPGELDAVRRWRDELQARGTKPAGQPLRPASEATPCG